VAGRFITLEGIEGVGKSTNLALVDSLVRESGRRTLVTREPGGTGQAERLREVLLHHESEPMPDLAELLIMFAARCLHLENRIRPALAEGTWVICDRFTDATYAYQGGGRGQDPGRIAALEEWVQEGLQPDLTLLLDADPRVGMERVGTRGAPDRFEKERLEFFDSVRQAYMERARRFPDRFVVIDAGRPLEAVQSDVRSVITKIL
jgi:dTMP kinase